MAYKEIISNWVQEFYTKFEISLVIFQLKLHTMKEAPF